MANPQPDKFTKLSNELFEAYLKICRKLSPYESAVWLCVLRKTYGYNKKEDWISLSQIRILTGILETHIARAIKKLKAKKMIIHKGEKGRIFLTGIQKDFDSWLLPKQVIDTMTQTGNSTMTQTGQKLLPKQVIALLPKQVITKENVKEIKEISTIVLAASPPSPLKYFYASYKQKTGQDYIANFAKDGAIFKDLAKIIPEEDIKALIDKFLDSDDDFIRTTGRTIGVFRTQVNKLRTGEKPLTSGQQTYINGLEAFKKMEEVKNVGQGKVFEVDGDNGRSIR